MTIHFNRYNLCFDKYTECRDKCKSLYFIVLHMRVVPLSFSHFCGISAIKYNVLNDRVFPHGCYRTLVGCKGSGFLGISVVCGVVFLFQKVLNSRKSIIEAENFCRIYIRFA